MLTTIAPLTFAIIVFFYGVILVIIVPFLKSQITRFRVLSLSDSKIKQFFSISYIKKDVFKHIEVDNIFFMVRMLSESKP